MTEFIPLETIEDFESLKKGDWVTCEFHRYLYRDKNDQGVKSGCFQIYDNNSYKEIILDKKRNLYFNYELFITKDSGSNLKSCALIKFS